MSEYYIKFDSQQDASGPFGVQQLQAFAENQKLSPETLHYFDDGIGWRPISDNPSLMEELWPNGKKLKFKTPPPPAACATVPQVRQTVKEMQESVEGKTASCVEQTQPDHTQPMGEKMALRLVGLLHLAMGAFLLAPIWGSLSQAIAEGKWLSIFNSVPAALGVWCWIVMLAGLFLWRVCYSWARYTALVLLGYFALHATLSFSTGQLQSGWLLSVAAISFGVGVYSLTLTTRFRTFCVALGVAFVGALTYGWACFL